MIGKLIIIIAGITLAILIIGVFIIPMNESQLNNMTPTRQPTPEPTQSSNASLSKQYDLILSVDDFEYFLTRWNEKMSWGFTPQQISNYSTEMKQGVLIKYHSQNHLAVVVQDIPTFCHDIGKDLGLTEAQSELFIQTAEKYYRESKMAYELHPTIPVTQN